jgi:hypothetical protein
MPRQLLDVVESKAAISRFRCDDLSASESIIAGKFCDNTKETGGIKAGGIDLSAYWANTRNRARICTVDEAILCS